MRIKKRTILLIIVVLLIGIIIGSQNSIGTSNYFEEAKNEFEEEITKPENNYQTGITGVEGNIVSKVAVKIDDTINDVFTAILSRLS